MLHSSCLILFSADFFFLEVQMHYFRKVQYFYYVYSGRSNGAIPHVHLENVCCALSRLQIPKISGTETCLSHSICRWSDSFGRFPFNLHTRRGNTVLWTKFQVKRYPNTHNTNSGRSTSQARVFAR